MKPRIPLGWQYQLRALRAGFGRKPERPGPPVAAVGALGGSGTRGVVRILEAAGIWMGQWTDPRTRDSLAMRHLLKRRFAAMRAVSEPRQPIPGDVADAFRTAMAVHAWRVPDGAAGWGWKNPRNMWLIPFLRSQFPGLRFIHLIRDGRAMALTGNRFLMSRSGREILGADWHEDPRVCQLRLWTYGNVKARQDALRFLGDERYLCIRYEDLCTKPEAVIAQLLTFLDIELDTAALRRLADELEPSSRLNTWPQQWRASGLQPEPETRAALVMFGYPEAIT